MAAITRNPRESRVQEKGARGIKEALLAGPASGCTQKDCFGARWLHRQNLF
jgi:hypothetical protein